MDVPERSQMMETETVVWREKKIETEETRIQDGVLIAVVVLMVAVVAMVAVVVVVIPDKN